MRLMRLTLLAVAAGAAIMQPARAGLFEDDEARKAILDLRAKVQANEDAAKRNFEQINALIEEGSLDHDEVTEQWVEHWAYDVLHPAA